MGRPVSVFVVALVLLQWRSTDALTCTQRDMCSCTLDDGSGAIDVTTLGSNGGTALFPDIPALDGSLYSLNLCYPFNELACFNAAACQILSDMTTSYQIGDASNVGFEVDTLNQVHVKYTSIDGTGLTRTTDVTLVCNPAADPAQVSAEGETAPGSVTYGFTVNSKCACPGGCGGGPPPDPSTTTKGPGPGPGPVITITGGISIGTILIIVVLSLGFSYIVGGILYMKMVRHAQGTEVVPNVSFWKAIPGFVRDGIMFSVKKCRGIGGKKYDQI